MSEQEPIEPSNPTKRSALAFFTWWRTDPATIEKQVSQYDTLKIYQSARGVSLLLCALTVAITVLVGSLLSLSSSTIAIDAVAWMTLGLFMFRGARWAFVAGMILWTLEKAAAVYGDVTGAASGPAPIGQIIWWIVYMNAFMTGLRVERARKRVPSVVAT